VCQRGAGTIFEYSLTHLVPVVRVHACHVADELSVRESALRKLPLPYSLALRLRDAGVAPEVVSEYVGVEETALDGVYRIAEAKLMSARSRLEERATSADEASSSSRAQRSGEPA
jgi:hypothetical protein